MDRNGAGRLAAAVAGVWGGGVAGAGTTFVETFEGGQNAAGWSFNVTTPDEIRPMGGNPGAYLANPGIFSFAPRLTSGFGVPSPFVGDLRAQGVTSIGLDARLDFVSISAEREMSILLRDTKGTPDNFDDDDYAYFVNGLIPQVGQGWVPYDFAIPSGSMDPVPAGWSGGWSGDLENFRPGVTWNDVITAVDQVEFWFINPSFFAIIQEWSVGVDNVRVTAIPGPGGLGVLGAGGLLLARRRRAAR